MSEEINHIVEDIWAQYDLDKNGTISLAESAPFFKQLIANRPDLGLTESQNEEWFKGIDGDSDGTISREEIAGYLGGINYTHHHH